MISRCHECALSIEKQKNYYVCQIRETIEKNPVIFLMVVLFLNQE